MAVTKSLSEPQVQEILKVLAERFEKNRHLHIGIEWKAVEEKLVGHPNKLSSIMAMEQTGGEPDVIDFDAKTGEYLFCDCSEESPVGRRSLCYDQQALDARKNNKPANSAVHLATAMGAELLSETQYNHLQSLGKFDLKTSSWLKTPQEVRDLGGAIFGDRRFNRVFIYHNGADSYYAARGFRALVRI